jgi:hypothetical protein
VDSNNVKGARRARRARRERRERRRRGLKNDSITAIIDDARTE